MRIAKKPSLTAPSSVARQMHWRIGREKKAHRLFLASGLYLRLLGGCRMIMLYYSDKEMLAAPGHYLDELNRGKFFVEAESVPLTT
jgi:hypothetical protein